MICLKNTLTKSRNDDSSSYSIVYLVIGIAAVTVFAISFYLQFLKYCLCLSPRLFPSLFSSRLVNSPLHYFLLLVPALKRAFKDKSLHDFGSNTNWQNSM